MKECFSSFITVYSKDNDHKQATFKRETVPFPRQPIQIRKTWNFSGPKMKLKTYGFSKNEICAIFIEQTQIETTRNTGI